MSSALGFQCISPKLPATVVQRKYRPIVCSAAPKRTTRRALFRSAAAAIAAISHTPLLLDAPIANAKPAPGDLQSAVVPVVMCRTVMTPVRRYIEEGEWDRSRTNINYCTRILALKKNIRKSADFLEGDAFYDALDIAGELENIMTQLDATVYTPLFIPSDDGVSVEQRKYQKQAFAFYDMAIENIDSFLAVVPPPELAKAREKAKGEKYEIPVEAN